jgi:hypothetical protein
MAGRNENTTGDLKLCDVCNDMLSWNSEGVLRAIKRHHLLGNDLSVEAIRRNQQSCKWCSMLGMLLIPEIAVTRMSVFNVAPWLSTTRRLHRTENETEEFGVLTFEFCAWNSVTDVADQARMRLGGIDIVPISASSDPSIGDGLRSLQMATPIKNGKLDITAIRGELDGCARNACIRTTSQNQAQFTSLNVTFIDTELLCLVDGTTTKDYVCLSYVWGGVDSLKATIGTRSELRKPGALQSADIAMLIKDAITLCRELGQKYLWVDQLCIEQDNSSQKHDQIPRMNVIYQQSRLTLIAWASKSSSDRIPGLTQLTIYPSHSPLVVLRNSAMRAHLHLQEAIELENRTYKSRGWTLQEEWLSPRRLYLGKYAVLIIAAHVMPLDSVTRYSIVVL